MKGKLSFVWQGVSQPHIREHWKDGLYAAMKILEKEYEVEYCEPWDEMTGDVILYWEAPCTMRGQNAYHYMNVMNKLQKKILLFAGGPIKKEWVKGFDMLCVESKINLDECNSLGIPAITAFGINDEIFYPKELPKIYDAIHHGTCASWKRQDLFGRAMKEKGIVVGRHQESDANPFNVCKEMGTKVIDEQPYDAVCDLINQSMTLVQTADFWGGGQRATLEAMACNVPVICMSDSPKNREFVEESGFGAVVEPQEEAIRNAVSYMFGYDREWFKKGSEYVKSKWTARHYADSLKEAINLCQK